MEDNDINETHYPEIRQHPGVDLACARCTTQVQASGGIGVVEWPCPERIMSGRLVPDPYTHLLPPQETP